MQKDKVTSSWHLSRHARGTHCTWLNRQEWEAVYTWMYSNDSALMHCALGRVAAWMARGALPLPVEVTADLVHCRLWELEHRGTGGEGAERMEALVYSMAITRFVNCLTSIYHCNSTSISPSKGGSIVDTVSRFGVPSWIVMLRHEGTHRCMPSVSALRSGVEFALAWLRVNYWEPQQELVRSLPRAGVGVGDQRTGARPREGEEGALASRQVTAVQERRSSGAVAFKKQLFNQVGQADVGTLVLYLKEGKILRLPPEAKYKVKLPVATDLAVFPELVGSKLKHHIHFWKDNLAKVCRKDSSTKQRLLSALIMVIHEPGCAAGTRDYLAAWLAVFLQEHCEIATESVSGMHVVQAVDAEKHSLAGSVDWLELMRVAKEHPGYYSSALMDIILKHASGVLSQRVVKKLKYLTTLVTLSERIGSSLYVPWSGWGEYSCELESLQGRVRGRRTTRKVAAQQRRKDDLENDGAPPAKRPRMEEEGSQGSHQQPPAAGGGESCRWKAVTDMAVWSRCPLGLCPGQTLSPTSLDLPVGTPPPHPLQPNTSGLCVGPEEATAEDMEEEEEEEESASRELSRKEIRDIQQQITFFYMF